MKKVLTIIAAACAIYGCTKFSASTPENEQNQLISFQATNYVSGTKADDQDGQGHLEFDKESFKVQAYYTGVADWSVVNTFDPVTVADAVTFMDGVTVSKTGNVWAPAADYFWPKTGKLTFIGWYPTDLSLEFNLGGGEQLHDFLRIKAPVRLNDDILLSDFARDKTIADAGTTTHFAAGVPLLFHHILAKINFKAKLVDNADADGITHHVVLKSCNILQVIDDGYYVIKGENADTGKDPWKPIWEPNSEYNDFLYDEYYRQSHSTIDIGNTIASGVEGELTTTPADLLKDVYVIPQTLADCSVVELTYVIYYCNSAGKVLDRLEVTKSSPISDRQFKLNTFSNSNGKITSWDENKIYTYTIVVDPNSDQKITFDPAVVDWEEADEAEREI